MGITVDEDGFEQEVKQDQGVNFVVWSKYLFKGKQAFEQAMQDAEEMFHKDHKNEPSLTNKSPQRLESMSQKHQTEKSQASRASSVKGSEARAEDPAQSEEGVNHERVGA